MMKIKNIAMVFCMVIFAASMPSANVASTAIAEIHGAEPTITPTNVPRPAATNTPVPEPIVLTGSGDSIVDFEKWEGAALLHIKYAGGGNFAVGHYPADSNENYDLLVNTIGSYEGTLPLDFIDPEQTARFEVKAAGVWEMQILPINLVRAEDIPGTFQGTGDDVIYLRGDGADLLKIDASSARGNFIVKELTRRGSIDLIVNEIAPYTGTLIFDPTALALIIRAEGPWSVEVSTK